MQAEQSRDRGEVPDFESRVSAEIDRLSSMGFHVTANGRVKPDGAAAFLGIEQKTLRNWRYLKKGPQWFSGAGPTWYMVSDLLQYLDLAKVDLAE